MARKEDIINVVCLIPEKEIKTLSHASSSRKTNHRKRSQEITVEDGVYLTPKVIEQRNNSSVVDSWSDRDEVYSTGPSQPTPATSPVDERTESPMLLYRGASPPRAASPDREDEALLTEGWGYYQSDNTPVTPSRLSDTEYTPSSSPGSSSSTAADREYIYLTKLADDIQSKEAQRGTLLTDEEFEEYLEKEDKFIYEEYLERAHSGLLEVQKIHTMGVMGIQMSYKYNKYTPFKQDVLATRILRAKNRFANWDMYRPNEEIAWNKWIKKLIEEEGISVDPTHSQNSDSTVEASCNVKTAIPQ
jgi:hypothetical protein